MITSFIQYLLMAPSYIAVLNVYAVSYIIIYSADFDLLFMASSQTYTMSHGVPRATTKLAPI